MHYVHSINVYLSLCPQAINLGQLIDVYLFSPSSDHVLETPFRRLSIIFIFKPCFLFSLIFRPCFGDTLSTFIYSLNLLFSPSSDHVLETTSSSNVPTSIYSLHLQTMFWRHLIDVYLFSPSSDHVLETSFRRSIYSLHLQTMFCLSILFIFRPRHLFDVYLFSPSSDHVLETSFRRLSILFIFRPCFGVFDVYLFSPSSDHVLETPCFHLTDVYLFSLSSDHVLETPYRRLSILSIFRPCFGDTLSTSIYYLYLS